MQDKRWIFPKEKAEITKHLMQALTISQPLASILTARNINTFDEARKYFRPSLEMLHDPFLMKDMSKAVDRIAQAINREEKILIYGDYDVDGTTSVAMFYHFLSSIYSKCTYYIPDRYKEGYGVSLQGIEYAEKEGFNLIITLDCGIKSVALVELAHEKQIDFIICDHHEPGAELPAAYAVLDPKRKDCDYPYKELSGCGVGFKLIQAFVDTHPGVNYDVFTLLDLVCISIAADIVPITGENRILAFFGLKQLMNAPRPGILSLMEIAGIRRDEITISKIVFGIAPRINAAGRLEDAKSAVRLMLAEDALPALKFAQQLDGHNSDRKTIDRMITKEAKEMILEKGMQHTKTTVLYKEDWHKGVIGIVASRCIESYYRPTIILTQTEEGILTGSARSVEGFDLYSALMKCSDLLEQFGGHQHAAGMTIRDVNLEQFRQRFETVVAEHISEELLTPSLPVDTTILLNEITPKFNRILKQMAPFGPGNTEPVLAASNLMASHVRSFSARNNPDSSHLKMKVFQEGSNLRFDAIGFNMGEYAEKIMQTPQHFSMAFSVSENTYRGETSLQLYVKDIRWE